MRLDYWSDAQRHLSRQDPTLKEIISSYEGEMLVSRGDAFYTLARSIAGQQISVKAADSVWKKLEGLVDINPPAILKSDPDTLRSAGLSRQKVVYMQSLAEHFKSHPETIARWGMLGDDAIITELTTVKGIGRWTAEMFLIFHMGRPDIFPVADIGLQKAIFRHYNKEKPIPLKKIRKLAETWRPYRTVATWYLWRSLDPIPVVY